jgi:protein dithiol oxidoreductase (disulfide-forming)
MNRREFTGATLVSSLAAAWALPAQAQAPALKPTAGKDYLALSSRAPVDAPADKVEVIEFFWYSCPHCNRFEPALEEWVKKLPKDVAFKRVPVAFRADFAPQQRLYYALEALGRLDDLHRKVFYAIHVERQPLNQDDAVIAWAEKQGLDKARFNEAYKSFNTANKLRRAVQLQDAYRVEGVPSLGIAGRFYTDGTLGQNMDRALQVTDHLIAEARRSR